MLHIIEVGPQVKIDDVGFPLINRFSHSVDRFMRCPFRSVSIRLRLEIGFEDRFQNELECSLDHAITDRWNREDADLGAPVLRNLFLRARMGRYVFETNSSLICSRKLFTPLSSIASNVTPSIPGAPSFFLAIQ